MEETAWTYLRGSLGLPIELFTDPLQRSTRVAIEARTPGGKWIPALLSPGYTCCSNRYPDLLAEYGPDRYKVRCEDGSLAWVRLEDIRRLRTYPYRYFGMHRKEPTASLPAYVSITGASAYFKISHHVCDTLGLQNSLWRSTAGVDGLYELVDGKHHDGDPLYRNVRNPDIWLHKGLGERWFCSTTEGKRRNWQDNSGQLVAYGVLWPNNNIYREAPAMCASSFVQVPCPTKVTHWIVQDPSTRFISESSQVLHTVMQPNMTVAAVDSASAARIVAEIRKDEERARVMLVSRKQICALILQP